ncbi:hypothetical protein [Thermocoleostomius sinensis]|uniref:Uncharacterized protein n=1 Tax=Thermocoleostomius sinensis A174 TaxID=2016057 RepID=A0A9E8ZA57_9CYAN|nr:hypothetical protein [Thermocoleostomius sinensis]WAL59368.1 hypothetical protein OXH18_19660 [Thermocoleostomius sinensis A174]
MSDMVKGRSSGRPIFCPTTSLFLHQSGLGYRPVDKLERGMRSAVTSSSASQQQVTMQFMLNAL